MEDSAHTLMLRICRDIPDQRMPGKVIHKLHDRLVITFGKVFSVINPDAFELRIQQWIHGLVGSGTHQKQTSQGRIRQKLYADPAGNYD